MLFAFDTRHKRGDPPGQTILGQRRQRMTRLAIGFGFNRRFGDRNAAFWRVRV